MHVHVISPNFIARPAVVARILTRIPLWPGGLQASLHRVGAVDAHRICKHPAGICHPDIVPPSDYVELQALEIAKDEIVAEAARHAHEPRLDRAPRPWPFRWPADEKDAVATQLPPIASNAPGQYLDIYA